MAQENEGMVRTIVGAGQVASRDEGDARLRADPGEESAQNAPVGRNLPERHEGDGEQCDVSQAVDGAIGRHAVQTRWTAR